MGDKSSTIWKNTRGDQIDDNRVVFLNWETDEKSGITTAKLVDDDAGDSAYVREVRVCDVHSACRILLVTVQWYPSTDVVHVDNNTKYTVAWRK